MTAKRSPITIFFFFFLPLLLLAMLEIIGFYTITPHYPLFFYPGTRDEKSSILYSKLDPLLGYTFDRTEKSTIFEKQYGATLDQNWLTQGSYIQFSYPEVPSDPKNILILGGSATDSNLFNGNWPYQLHLLLKKKYISHNIYNGAVSGYSSNQELIKLQRDLLQFKKIDLIIIFDGINDTLDNEDITPEYPWVHPYEKLIYSKTSNKELPLTHPTYFPNALKPFRFLIRHNTKRLALGLPTKDYVGRFLFNIQSMHAIAQIKGIPFLHVMQPLAWTKSQRAKSYLNDTSNEFQRNIKLFYKAADPQRFKYSYNLDEIFKQVQQGNFRDFSHQNDNGNQKVAFFLYRELIRRKILK